MRMNATKQQWLRATLLTAMCLLLCMPAGAEEPVITGTHMPQSAELPTTIAADTIAKKTEAHLPVDTITRVSKAILDQIIDTEVERVIVGKDTVSIIIPEKNYGRFHRGIFSYLFIPKGKFSFGLTASAGKISSDEMEMLNYVADLSFTAKAVSIKPYLSYFYKHNKEIGVRLGISNTDINLESLDVDFDDDINFSLRDVIYKTNTTTVSVFHRNYVGLDRGHRFAIFNEVALRYDGSNGTFSRLYNDEPKVTESRSHTLRLDFSPGLCVFIHEKIAFNLSFGIFGWYWKREKQTTNGTDEGTYSTSGAKFKFNLFNLNMGVSVYI